MSHPVASARERTLLSAAVEFAPIELLAASPRRTGVALAISAVAHAAAFALALVTLSMRPNGPTTPIVVFPISLVSAPAGGGSGGGTTVAPEPPPAAEAKPAEPRPAEAAPPPPVPIARPKPNAKPKPAPSPATAGIPGTTAPGAPTAGGPGDGSAGPGGNGRGFASASPQYGTNPQPPYPIAARRLGIEGTVVLRVVVAPDGTPRDVSVMQSSGHGVLDDAAATTVRSRWRFVPARRDGVPIEDSVQVPIRFHRTEG